MDYNDWLIKIVYRMGGKLVLPQKLIGFVYGGFRRINIVS